MTRKVGPWQVREIRASYDNPWIRIDHHEVIRPDGVEGIYGVVRFANLAVGVLPIFEDGTTMLVGQHRFPLDLYSWELPEGGGPMGEPSEETARRELAEETGLKASHLAPLGIAHMSNSVTDERAEYYIAWGLEEGEAAPEPDEVLALRRLPLSEVVMEIAKGRITDSLTILMVHGAILNAQIGLLPDAPAGTILSEMRRLQGAA